MQVVRSSRREGVAAVEFALLAPVLITVLVGLWEVGRLVQSQQILSNAAREGARIAAQGMTINSTSTPTQIQVDGGTPSVKQTIHNYLTQAGISVPYADLVVEFTYLTGDTTKTQPYEGIKGQQFRVLVRVPYQYLRWTTLGILDPTTLSTSVVWSCLVDDPFTIDTTMPTW